MTRSGVASATAAVLFFAGGSSAEPVRVSSANPHYFERDGKPIVLVTSDHHYGAVLDADFDFGRYLDALAAGGMNLTRIYPGGMFEVEDKYVARQPARAAAGTADPALGAIDGARRAPRARSAGAAVIQGGPRPLEPRLLRAAARLRRARRTQGDRRRGRVLQRHVRR